MSDAGIPHLLFEAGETSYLISIKELVEIVPAAEISRLPGSAGNIRGLMNYRGEVIGIVDLEGTQTEISGAQTRIIVVKYNNEKFGVPASKVREVVNVPAEAQKTGIAPAGKVNAALITPAALFTQASNGRNK